ncbi:hypothetical protein [Candidatus Palauibacter sp.]|uniref:hypothetical protein n=1 Tax=Candidatus Palauibacter sp. TaxID=3101350 RepID=UPI003AF1E846
MKLPDGWKLTGEVQVTDKGREVHEVERESDGEQFWMASTTVRVITDARGRLTKPCEKCEGDSCWRCGGVGRVLEDGSRVELIPPDDDEHGDPLPGDPSQ